MHSVAARLPPFTAARWRLSGSFRNRCINSNFFRLLWFHVQQSIRVDRQLKLLDAAVNAIRDLKLCAPEGNAFERADWLNTLWKAQQPRSANLGLGRGLRKFPTVKSIELIAIFWQIDLEEIAVRDSKVKRHSLGFARPLRVRSRTWHLRYFVGLSDSIPHLNALVICE